MDWTAIVHRNAPSMLRLAKRIVGRFADAEEVVQDAFLRAYQSYAGEAVTNWGGLLHRLTANASLDRLRTNRNTEPIYADQVAAPEADDPVATVLAQELAERLRSRVAELPPQQATVFCLYYFDGKSNQEIVDLLQVSAGTVATALYKARKYLALSFSKSSESLP